MTDKKKNRAYTGTREWSVKSVNCVTGCSHNCKYCYARSNAVDRWGLTTSDDWTNMQVRVKDIKKKRNLEKGTVMFPTTHDITPEVLEPCLTVLQNLIDAKNHILIVSKPHIECIKKICDTFWNRKDQILFRFTIGTFDNTILKYWEPGAPAYDERLECLEYAYRSGFATSISVEPMLDPENIEEHVKKMAPYVTDSIWIGHMNKTNTRVKLGTAEDQQMLDRILDWQTEEKTKEIHELLKDHPLVKWKESIKKIMGIELATEPGKDK